MGLPSWQLRSCAKRSNVEGGRGHRPRRRQSRYRPRRRRRSMAMCRWDRSEQSALGCSVPFLVELPFFRRFLLSHHSFLAKPSGTVDAKGSSGFAARAFSTQLRQLHQQFHSIQFQMSFGRVGDELELLSMKLLVSVTSWSDEIGCEWRR